MLSTHLQATLASEKDQKSSQIVPHVPLYMTSTRPMCSPYVPLTNRISSISVSFPNGLGNWPAEEGKLIQVIMMLKFFFALFPMYLDTPNYCDVDTRDHILPPGGGGLSGIGVV